MTALKIIAVLAALLVLVSLTRAGAEFHFGDTLTVTAKVGFLRIQILPAKKKKKTQKEEKKPKKAQKKTESKPKSPFPKPAFADIRDAVKTLWSPLRRALERTRRGVRIDPLDVSLVVGGAAEPADAAALYGELSGAVWGGMPVLENLLNIPHPHIHLDVDFTAEKNRAAGSVGISARIGTLTHIGVSLMYPVLKWLLRYLKMKRTPVGKDDLNGNGKEKPAA